MTVAPRTGRPKSETRTLVEAEIRKHRLSHPHMPLREFADWLAKQRTKSGHRLVASTGRPFEASYLSRLLTEVPTDQIPFSYARVTLADARATLAELRRFIPKAEMSIRPLGYLVEGICTKGDAAKLKLWERKE